jgi:hypothetical protein
MPFESIKGRFSPDRKPPQRLPEERDRIERVKNSLYSRSATQRLQDQRTVLSQHDASAQDDWSDRRQLDDENIVDPYESHAPHPWVKRLFYGALGFFVIAFGIALFVYFRGTNVISSDNIDIAVAGPISVAGGQELDLTLTITNHNSTSLDNADLVVSLPDGSHDPANTARSITETSLHFDSIPAGGSVSGPVKVVLYGASNEQKQFSLVLTYNISNSNAIFEKDKTFSELINSSPVSVAVQSPEAINSGQPLQLNVVVSSNSSSVIKNTALVVSYPFGFTASSSLPAPASGNNVWYIGDLAPGSSRTITINGSLIGEEGDQRTFNFAAGVQDATNPSVLSPQLVTSSQSVSINRPFIGVNMALDGVTGQTYAVAAGQSIQGVISYVNNLSSQINNASIVLHFDGVTLDPSSVAAPQGFYQSSSNDIVWDSTTDQDLATLSPGASGRLTFNFASALPDTNSLDEFKNQRITLSVGIKGNGNDITGTPNAVNSLASQQVALNTNLTLVPQTEYRNGPFQNSGPLPPKVGKQTTYTVVWAIANSFNDVTNARVTATLPSYMTWLGSVSPSSEDVSYDPNSRSVTWNVPEVPAKTGFTSSPREVMFQVALVPSISQLASVPPLVTNIQIVGTDQYTGEPVGGSASDMTTTMANDPAFSPGYDKVSQ